MIDTELVEFQGWTLRVRATEHPTRLLLLIHGYTGDENSMWVFARDLPATYQMIAPRAMHPSGSTGYSWRASPDSDFGMPSLDQLRPAAEALIRLVNAYQESAGIDADQFDVMGFSQGAVMSNVLAFLYPQRVRKVGILAGFVPQGIEFLIPSRPLERKLYFVTHGTKDATVAIERARESIVLLEQAGAKVTYCEDEVGHKLSVHCLLALKRFFRD
jgi:phospholipase/carboxylesterase